MRHVYGKQSDEHLELFARLMAAEQPPERQRHGQEVERPPAREIQFPADENRLAGDVAPDRYRKEQRRGESGDQIRKPDDEVVDAPGPCSKYPSTYTFWSS